MILKTSIKKFADKSKVSYTKSDKLSSICDKLKNRCLLALSEWRQIQAWTDIGNAAAHGKFNDYTEKDVQLMLDGIESFIDIKLK